MPVLICLREKLWTRTYYIGDQVPTCPVFTCVKIKVPFWDFSQFAVTMSFPKYQKGRCKQPYPRFELGLPIPFPTAITVMLNTFKEFEIWQEVDNILAFHFLKVGWSHPVTLCHIRTILHTVVAHIFFYRKF